MAIDYLFVYGTLRSDSPDGVAEAKTVREVLRRHARRSGTGHCRGRLYRVGWYPALVPASTAGERVRGEVYRLLQPRRVLPILDGYEGFDSSGGDSLYLRKRVNIVLDNGESVIAWTYFYNRPVQGLNRIESGDFCRP